MKKIPLRRLQSILSRIKKVKILVIGDVMLDQFIWGKVNKISPEAPVPVVNMVRESFMPGGAANVVNNISSLGASVNIAGIVGADQSGEILKKTLAGRGVNVGGLIVDKERTTILKTRIIASHQQVVRVDRDGKLCIENEYIERMIRYISKSISKLDAIIIEDYGKGVITQELIDEIVKLARKHNKITAVDPKEDHFLDYSGATVVTPNHHEALSAAKRIITGENGLDNVGKLLLRKWNCGNILMTCGEDGMILFEKGKDPFKIPTVAKEVFDVSGAGDTTIGAFTTCLAAGATLRESAIISNYAAGIVVGKIGTATTTREEIISAMNRRSK